MSILSDVLVASPQHMAHALSRPGTYTGMALEAASLAADLVAFPLGLTAAPVRPPRTRWSDTTPAILVHGYGHNRSAWLWLSRSLRRAGIRDIETVNYNPIIGGIPEIGGRLRVTVDSVMRETGAEKVDIVGHSMGGIVARWMVQECDGWDCVRTCVTVGSPHEGTLTARFGMGRTARQLRPGSSVLRRLRDSMRPSDVRWVAYYSNLDALVVPQSSAKLRHPDAEAENVLVKDAGHLGLLFAPRLAEDIVRRLQSPSQSPAMSTAMTKTMSAASTTAATTTLRA